QIELMSDHARKYLQKAQQVAVDPSERPRLFDISAVTDWGYQANLGQLQAQAEAVALLGINNSEFGNWRGNYNDAGLATDVIARETAVLGVGNRFGNGELRADLGIDKIDPPYFDFNTDQLNPTSVQEVASRYAAGIAQSTGARPEDVVGFHVTDEPGWDYPLVIEKVAG